MRVTRSPMTAQKSPAVQGEGVRHSPVLLFLVVFKQRLLLGCLFLSNANMIGPRAL